MSDKIITFPKISLVEKWEIISDESKATNEFINFFENAIRSLGIKTNENSHEIAIKKFEQHPSINRVNENITNNEIFHFPPWEHKSILKQMINFESK